MRQKKLSIGRQTFGYGFQSTPLNYTIGGIGDLGSLSLLHMVRDLDLPPTPSDNSEKDEKA